MSGRGGTIYLLAEGVNNNEILMIVVNDNVTNSIDVTNGVFSGVDKFGSPIGGRIVLSRRDLENDEIRKYILRQNVLRSNPIRD